MTAINIRPINEDLKKIAREELNEVDSRIAVDINTLRSWIEKQPHLKARTDDQFLVSFLRGCKYSMEKVKSKLDYFYTIKTMVPELYANNIMDERMLNFYRTGTFILLPNPLGPGGPRIELLNLSKFDPKIYNLMDLYRLQSLLVSWKILQDDHSVISGYLQVVDLSKLNFSILSQFEPIVVKKMAVFAEKATPMRVKGVHLVNCPKEGQTLLNFAKTLMTSKIQQRFYVHKSMKDLYKFIDKSYLPLEYGGTNGTISDIVKESEKDFLAFNEVLKENDRYGVNEKLRPNKAMNMDSVFGLEGSFRKLDID